MGQFVLPALTARLRQRERIEMATNPTERQLKALRAAQKLEKAGSAITPLDAAEECENKGWIEAQPQGGYILTESGRMVLRAIDRTGALTR